MYNWLAGSLLIRDALDWGATSILAAAPALHAPMKTALRTVE
ncbi:hypothetical protein [Archangium lipolyticum]|nr:hypothetical protein [Archangium lipolyticum]